MHFGIKLDNYEEIKRSGIDYLHNNLTIISKRLELIALQENTRGYSSGKNLSKGYSKLLSAQQVLLAEIEELEGKYSLADIERVKVLDKEIDDLTEISMKLSHLKTNDVRHVERRETSPDV
ncbi:hypothetical protein BN59_03495 [Legionella massiliensis]|uniref:Uncharacterized protein n=2 Tax=Legionella massiliensis TaxID=1034943 RepID=A0A078L1P7_9GAMM|nr:hypothetical protein BN59_03495 [Legionella massiliensis]CEE14915.1 hypothetical protein BN1094_03495 [Legionella massiliensis]